MACSILMVPFVQSGSNSTQDTHMMRITLWARCTRGETTLSMLHKFNVLKRMRWRQHTIRRRMAITA